MRIRNITATALICFVCCACAPKLTIDGKAVTTDAATKTFKCRHLANSRITLGKFRGNLTKNPEKLAAWLLIEARNLAAELGADTVSPTGEIENMQQKFKFYVCNKP